MSCDMTELNKRIGVQDRIKFFEESQGGRSAAVIWNGWMIWEDGTARELSGGGHGVLRDVSWFDKDDVQESKKTLWFRIRYYQVKLSDSIKQFDAAKKELTARASDASAYGGQPPTIDELKQVRRLRHKVKGFEKKLEELLEVLNPPPEPITYSKEQVEKMSENRAEAESVLSALEKLEI